MMSPQHRKGNMFRRILFIFGASLLGSCTVGPQQLGIPSQQWQVMNKAERQQMRTAYRDIQRRQHSLAKMIYSGPDIQVTINGGTAMMTPFLQAYVFKSVKFKMRVGECRYIRLTDWEGTHSVDLWASYDGLTFMLDPSRYDLTKSNGALLLTYNPLWKHGFTYSGLSSSGYVRLNNATITIHTISQLAPVNHVNYSSI